MARCGELWCDVLRGVMVCHVMMYYDMKCDAMIVYVMIGCVITWYGNAWNGPTWYVMLCVVCYGSIWESMLRYDVVWYGCV